MAGWKCMGEKDEVGEGGCAAWVKEIRVGEAR